MYCDQILPFSIRPYELWLVLSRFKTTKMKVLGRQLESYQERTQELLDEADSMQDKLTASLWSPRGNG